MAHFPPLLTLPKIQNDVSVWSKIESSAQPKKTISIYQINRTDSARVFYQTTKFDKQQTSTFCLLSRRMQDYTTPHRLDDRDPRTKTGRTVQRIFFFFQI